LRSPRYHRPIDLSVTSANIDVRAIAYFHNGHGAITRCIIHRVNAAAMPLKGSRSFSGLVSP
ncbi:MAG TPA: hypothetical protein VGR69_00145, partial [Candidatus Rubrimentiphilum sp.]|nr:hypothetical protein [Candidatus Rubrimentiphilum sp.]